MGVTKLIFWEKWGLNVNELFWLTNIVFTVRNIRRKIRKRSNIVTTRLWMYEFFNEKMVEFWKHAERRVGDKLLSGGAKSRWSRVWMIIWIVHFSCGNSLKEKQHSVPYILLYAVTSLIHQLTGLLPTVMCWWYLSDLLTLSRSGELIVCKNAICIQRLLTLIQFTISHFYIPNFISLYLYNQFI